MQPNGLMPWAEVSMHVIPTGDTRPHSTDMECPCIPYIKLAKGGKKIAVHTAWDGRK